VVKRPGLRITKQPGYLFDRDAVVFEVLKSEASSKMIEDLTKAGALLGKTPPERPLAHTELRGYLRDLHLAASAKHAE
jgi:hypothetical protein